MYMTIIFKLLLSSCLANQSQILCGGSLGKRDKNLYKWSKSHDQDGHHSHVYIVKTFRNHLPVNQKSDNLKLSIYRAMDINSLCTNFVEIGDPRLTYIYLPQG